MESKGVVTFVARSDLPEGRRPLRNTSLDEVLSSFMDGLRREGLTTVQTRSVRSSFKTS